MIDPDLLVRPRRRGPDHCSDLDAGTVEALTVHLCAEQRLAGWYSAFGSSATEPGLGRIFTNLALAASQRAAACAGHLRGAVQRDPGVLPAVLRTALWMTRIGETAPEAAAPALEGTPAGPEGDRHCIGRMLGLYRLLTGAGGAGTSRPSVPVGSGAGERRDGDGPAFGSEPAALRLGAGVEP
jgi:hypothetical protein